MFNRPAFYLLAIGYIALLFVGFQMLYEVPATSVATVLGLAGIFLAVLTIKAHSFFAHNDQDDEQ